MTSAEQYVGQVVDRNQRAPQPPAYEMPGADPEFLGNEASQVVHPPVDSPSMNHKKLLNPTSQQAVAQKRHF